MTSRFQPPTGDSGANLRKTTSFNTGPVLIDSDHVKSLRQKGVKSCSDMQILTNINKLLDC